MKISDGPEKGTFIRQVFPPHKSTLFYCLSNVIIPDIHGFLLPQSPSFSSSP